MGEKERRAYDYDYLENKYVENQNKTIDDIDAINKLRNEIVDSKRSILLVAPGRSSIDEKNKIDNFIKENSPIVIGVNAILPIYKYDYLFFVNKGRYEYAENAYKDIFDKTKKIVLSNIKTGAHEVRPYGVGSQDHYYTNEVRTYGVGASCASPLEYIVSYNHAIKRGFMHFDNAVISALRFLDFLFENSNVGESLQSQKSVGVSSTKSHSRERARPIYLL
jgi:4-hydroxy 2-oxovalerate aldolase